MAATITNRAARYRSLDAWRGIACLLVIVHHSTMYVAGPSDSFAGISGMLLWTTSWMSIGVPLFFVISGYCITASVDACQARNAPVREFFLRRFRRIYPPFWINLALWAGIVTLVERFVWPGLFLDEKWPIYTIGALDGWQWLGNLTLSESWRSIAVGSDLRYLTGHTWTLCFEEQFYAVSGIILLLMPRRFFVGAGLITIGSLLIKLVKTRWHFDITGLFCNGNWMLFAAGIVVYYRVNYAHARQRWLIDAAIGAAVAAVIIATLLGRCDEAAAQGLIVAGLFAAILCRLHAFDARLTCSRWARPLMFCGTISYSLYLVHWPIAKGLSHALFIWGVRSPLASLLVTVPLCITTSLAVGALFHTLVERRFLNRPARSRPEFDTRGELPIGGLLHPPQAA
jgi:peptidoglycan/LPS O-acetylase OafA/YrhL